jgi:hypothetical protein
MKTVLDNANSIPNGTLQFGTINVSTPAQAMTLIAYSDSPHLQPSNIPFSLLQFKAECKNFADFCACLRIIGGYRGFNSEDVIKQGTPHFNIKRWYPADNGNHGIDMFDFEIAREYSATFYVRYVTLFNNRKLIEIEGERGDCEEFTPNDFEDTMLCLKHLLKPSEFDIEKSPYEACGKIQYSYSVRFCWT